MKPVTKGPNDHVDNAWRISSSGTATRPARCLKVLFTSVNELPQNLYFSKADNSFYQKLSYYLAPDLLILDKLGFKILPNYSFDDFFENTLVKGFFEGFDRNEVSISYTPEYPIDGDH